MFGSLGGPELILILVLALIIFGPRKLPEIGKSIGKMLVEFRRASNDFKRTIEEEVDADKASQTQAAPQLLEAAAAEPPQVVEAPPGTVAASGSSDSGESK